VGAPRVNSSLGESPAAPAGAAIPRGTSFWSCRAAVKTIWQRGVTRGEFREDVDADVAMDMIFAPIVYRLLAGNAPLSESLAEQLVDAALGGLATVPAPGAPRRHSPARRR